MSQRDKLTRIGCDSCKEYKGTYVFNHFDETKVWICEQCLEKLLEWKEHQL